MSEEGEEHCLPYLNKTRHRHSFKGREAARLHGRTSVPNYIGTRDWFRGTTIFPQIGRGVVSGRFKRITFIVHFFSINTL